MKFPEIGEKVTITNPENNVKKIGEVKEINKNNIKICFPDGNWIIIELKLSN